MSQILKKMGINKPDDYWEKLVNDKEQDEEDIRLKIEDEYVIVEGGSNLDQINYHNAFGPDFYENIENYLAEGYKPVGGITIDRHNENITAYQVMYRTPQDKIERQARKNEKLIDLTGPPEKSTQELLSGVFDRTISKDGGNRKNKKSKKNISKRKNKTKKHNKK
jgi:hypothetical protein